MMVDERTGNKVSNFNDTKNGILEPKGAQFEKWRQANMYVMIVKQDNAGKNKKLQARSDQAPCKLNICFEYTAKDTPQQNI